MKKILISAKNDYRGCRLRLQSTYIWERDACCLIWNKFKKINRQTDLLIQISDNAKDYENKIPGREDHKILSANF